MLPIAPHWNWNSVKKQAEAILYDATNRTTLELKRRLPIRPKRLNLPTNRTTLELKLSYNDCINLNCILPIAPHWNWNGEWVAYIEGKLELPIAPHWNWNFRPGWNWERLCNSTNRTTLELKLGNRTKIFQCFGLPIAPHWNWNSKWWSPINFSRCYQSHHTGIETPVSGVKNKPAKPTNRTTLELKLDTAGNLITAFAPYQSHHTGIETAINQNRNRVIDFATNRTTLELKHEIMNIPFESQIFYQSHHTGIETPIGTDGINLFLLPIAPHWNWNCRQYMSESQHFHYQSHHTGIETRSGHECRCCRSATNRTTLELKLSWSCIVDQLTRTTNRTTLELKHVQ